MKESVFRIKENRNIAPLTFLMVLEGDCAGMDRPGQFVNIKIEGFFLRRPISVCDIRDSELTLIYKTVGKGTLAMSGMKEGQELSLLTGLGNGYDITKAGEAPLLMGGGAEHAQCLPPNSFLRPLPGTRRSKAKKDQRLSSNRLLQTEHLPHEIREEDYPPQHLCLSVSFMVFYTATQGHPP